MAKPKSPRSKGASDLEAQKDPKAPLDGAKLLAAARPVLKLLREDLLARAKASPAVTAALTARHEAEKAARRTADGFLVWQEHFVDQVAAAWFLSCVFARTLEDRGLVSTPRLAGPGAADSQHLFFEIAPSLTERDYLLTTFRELSRFAAARDLFDARHNPVWLLTPSAEAAKALLQLFRAPQADAPAFRFGQVDTRFLGDLYQDLDADVKERFALLQTPRFVESFILDRTLERAIEKFGLDETTLIDPTCGSGHFLLGAFDRLFDHRLRKSPGLDVREAARRALDAVFGADINPYAVAIARFRLTLAFLEKAGYQRLADAPALPLHLVVADSLLHNPQAEQSSFAEMEGQTAKAWSGDAFALEDEAAARDVLHRRFAAVVGNPPYITVKDAVMRKRYAEAYATCFMNYALAVPFCERFFQLAKTEGLVGMITANSFMKREFGKKLIEQYLPTVNVDLIINTSGAYIPGHGTPTVLLFGSASAPIGPTVPAVLAKRGEPSTPEDPSKGLVWSAIESNWNRSGFDNEYISTATVSRDALAQHPWSLGGGGASDLKALLEERAGSRLSDVIDEIGFSIIVGEDEPFIRPNGSHRFAALPRIPIVIGEAVRDWSIGPIDDLLMPLDRTTFEIDPQSPIRQELWPWRRVLECRVVSGSTTMKDSGRQWYDVRRLSRDKHRTPLTITFAFVATHNHFVLDRGGKVFKQSAPIIKLPETATEDDHLALLAYLNSSTACFWMKQVMPPKGMHNGSEANATPFLVRHEFAGTALEALPLPSLWGDDAFRARLATLARETTKACDAIATELVSVTVASVESSRERMMHHRLLAVRSQELIDWEVYRGFGLVGDTSEIEGWSPTSTNDRPFVAALDEADPGLAREWRKWHLGVDATSCAIAVPEAVAPLEQPEFKRRWIQPMGKGQALYTDVVATAERLELSAMESLEAEVRVRDREVWVPRNIEGAAALNWARWATPELDGATVVAAMFRDESIPYLAALRYSKAGMDIRTIWEQTWDLQRREDAGENVGTIPVPPKYDQTDFRDPNYYRLRGKLDVPKERFISYPGCESDEDGEPVYGWAGWNHLQQAQALAALYQKRKTEEAWGKDRLTPMLAGLLELLPWLKQWHNEPNDEYGGERLGDFFEAFIDGECRGLGLTHDDLRGWRPPERKSAARSGVAKKATKAKKPKSE